MKKIFSLILVIALLSAMFMGTAVQASGTATVTLSSTYAENGQYEVTATLSGGTVTNGDIVLNVGTNVTLKSLEKKVDTEDAQYNLSNGVLTFVFALAPSAAVDCTEAKTLFVATFEVAAGVDASEIAVPTFGTNDDGNTTTIQYLADEASTPVDFDVTLNTEDFKVEKDTITGVAFGNNTTIYNGQTQSVTVTGLPAGASVVYQNNEGKNVGTYQATATVSLAGYKNLVLNATLTITPAPVTITADSLEMTQNGTIPNFTYKVTSGTVYENDAITGALSATTDGTAVGTFPIAQGTLDVSSNYTLTFVDGILTVKEAAHTHSAKMTEANEATCTTDGNIDYWYCEGCDKYFSNEELTTEIQLADTVIKAAHQELAAVPAKPATCTEAGNIAYWHCSACGKTYSDEELTTEIQLIDTVLPAEHQGLTYKEPVSATCYTDGNIPYWHCSACGKYYSDVKLENEIELADTVDPKLNHQGKEHKPAVTPTVCGETGNIEHWYCIDCEKYFAEEACVTELDYLTEVLVTVEHVSLENVPAVPKTCDTPGKAEHWYCSTCQNFYSDAEGKVKVEEADLIIPASHELGTLIPAVPKTCDTNGTAAHYVCGGTCRKIFAEDGVTEKTEQELVIPASHELGEFVPEVPKTCDTNGTKAHYECEVCHKYFEDALATTEILDLTIPASHGQTEVIPGIAPTCETPGLTDGAKCLDCGRVVTAQETTTKLAHSTTLVPAVPATCETNGNIQYYECSACHAKFEDEEATTEVTAVVDPATGHAWGDWNVVTPAEVGVEGSKERVCANDSNHTETAVIPALDGECSNTANHETCEYVVVTPATCTQDGSEQRYCEVCGEYIGEARPIPASHTLNQVPATPNCLVDGIIAHDHCSVCGKNFVDGTEVETVVNPADTHKFGEFDVNGDAVCSVCGTTKHIDVVTTTDATFDVENLDKVLDASDAVLIAAGLTVKPMMDVQDTVPTTTLTDKLTALGYDALDKVVIDITIKKHVTNGSNVSYDIPVTDAPAIVSVEVKLPTALQGKTNYYAVRVHSGVAEEITTTPNGNGEYIEVDKANNIVKLHVKGFSEYAILGKTVSQQSRPSSSLGGGVTTTKHTVKFNTNGANVVENAKVESGETIAVPEVRKEGYAFDGWYKDANFKTAFDATEGVNKNITLYAKWIEKTDKNTIILTIGEKEATVFGEGITNDVAPQIVSDRTLLPIRFIAESLGATVGWEEETETVTVKLGDIDIVLVIGEMTATVNGEVVTLDVKSFVENDRTYLPLRFIAENLGAIVEWEEATEKVTIIER